MLFIRKNIANNEQREMINYAYYREEAGLYKFRYGNKFVYFSEEIAEETYRDRLGEDITDIQSKKTIVEIEEYLEKSIDKIYDNYPEYKTYIENHQESSKNKNTAILYAHGAEENGKLVYAGQDDNFYDVENFIKTEGSKYSVVICIVCNPESVDIDPIVSVEKVVLFADNTFSNARLDSGEVSINLMADGKEISAYEVEAVANIARNNQESIGPHGRSVVDYLDKLSNLDDYLKNL